MLAIVSVTAHKLRTENKENSYLDVCSPAQSEMNVTGVQLQRIMQSLIKEAMRMHREGDQGDLKIVFNIRVPASRFDDIKNLDNLA